MPSEKVQRLHKVYTSGIYSREPDPRLAELYDQPHLALFINGDWLPIIPGMIIGIVKNRKHVDGVAPYRLVKVNAKPGHERIDLLAYSTDPKSTRGLSLGAKYSGQFASGIQDADAAVDAAINSQKIGGEDD